MTLIPHAGIIASVLLALPASAAFSEAKPTQIVRSGDSDSASARTAAILATLPVSSDYATIQERKIEVDGESALLVRLERTDGRNAGLGGEHFSAVVANSGALKGFARMDLSLRDGALPSQDEAHGTAMRFLADHAADLLPRHEISFIAPHDEQIRANGKSAILTGMKVKMRNLADGR